MGRDATQRARSAPDGPLPVVPLRIGDEDRARTAAQLGEHYADGRLDLAEFDQRSTRAMSAVHQHELDALLADLPPLERARGGPPATRDTPTRPRPHPPTVLLALIGIGLVVLTQGAALWFLPLLWWVTVASRHRRRPRDTARREPRRST